MPSQAPPAAGRPHPHLGQAQLKGQVATVPGHSSVTAAVSTAASGDVGRLDASSSGLQTSRGCRKVVHAGRMHERAQRRSSPAASGTALAA